MILNFEKGIAMKCWKEKGNGLDSSLKRGKCWETNKMGKVSKVRI